VVIASDLDSLTAPGLQALRDGVGLTPTELARQMTVVRHRVATIESQATVPMLVAERYLQALEALAA
jgi:DNA-binding transcriptional regulator YiaG